MMWIRSQTVNSVFNFVFKEYYIRIVDYTVP